MAGPLAPLAARLGLEAGRLQPPQGWTPAEGSSAFVLGSDVPGIWRRLGAGDFLQVEQRGDLTGVNFVRLRARWRPPAAAPPAGTYWRLQLRLDEAARVVRVLERTLDRCDLALPVSAFAGVHRIAVRLELVGPAGAYEVELPAVYLDAVLLDAAAATPGLVNRDPEPGEQGVPLNANIVLELSSTVGVGIATIDAAATDVYVGGVLAYAGGAFQAGFTGPDSAQDATLDTGRTLRLVIDPLNTLPADAEVPVRVRSRIQGAAQTVESTYAFRTEDTVAPRLRLLRPTGRRTLLVQLTEQVLQANPAAATDALNPANWTVTAQLDGEHPAAPVRVKSVGPAPDGALDAVELTFDDDMTPRALYLLEAANFVDTAGNPIIAPANAGLFYGFVQQAPPGRDFQLEDMLPAMNVAEDETRDLARFVACLQEPTDGLLGDIDEWVDILDPDVAPERFVDAMLADLGNPFPFELDLTDKRRLVPMLVPLYAQKGTDPGIVNAVRFFLGVEVSVVVPAFQHVWLLGADELGVSSWLGTLNKKARYSFIIQSPVGLTPTQRKRITDIANYMKRECTHLIGIDEPAPPPPLPNHVELGLSELGVTWVLH